MPRSPDKYCKYCGSRCLEYQSGQVICENSRRRLYGGEWTYSSNEAKKVTEKKLVEPKKRILFCIVCGKERAHDFMDGFWRCKKCGHRDEEKENKAIVDIILLTMNQLSYTKKCIETLYKNTICPFRLIVVDNASTDGTVDFLKKLLKMKKNVAVYFNAKKDSGFANGINTGLRLSKSEFVLFLNNDVFIPQKGWLRPMIEIMDLEEKVGIVGCKLLYPNDTIQHAGAYFTKKLHWEHIGRHQSKEKYSTERELAGVTFACVLIRRKAIPDGLDERYLLGQWEDVDCCCNVRKNGWKIIYVPQTVLYHHESKTWHSEHSPSQRNQSLKNASRFHRKWNSWLRADMKKNPHLYNPDYFQPPKKELKKRTGKVAVILTSYNRPQLIKKAIKSVLKQTYQDFTLYIIDNNSSKAVKVLLRGYKHRHPDKIVLKFLKTKDSERLNKCWLSYMVNWALRQNNEPYIALLTDDCWFASYKLEVMVEFFETHPNVMMAYGTQYIMNSAGLHIRSREAKHVVPSHKGLGFLDHNQVMFRRALVKEIGYWSESTRVLNFPDGDFFNRTPYPKYPVPIVTDYFLEHKKRFLRYMLQNKKRLTRGELME